MASKEVTSCDSPVLTEQGAALLSRILLLPDADISTIQRRLIAVNAAHRARRFGNHYKPDTLEPCSSEAVTCCRLAEVLSFDDQVLLRGALTKRRSDIINENLSHMLADVKDANLRIQARHPEAFEGKAGRYERKPSKKLTTILKPEKKPGTLL